MDCVNVGSRLYRRRCFRMVALDNTFPRAHILQGHRYFTNFRLSAFFLPCFIALSSRHRALMNPPFVTCIKSKEISLLQMYVTLLDVVNTFT